MATQSEVITEWESDLSALDEVDILIAPATRDLLASYPHGPQHGFILMSLSATELELSAMMIPSMHADLADDPVTSELVTEVENSESSPLGTKMRQKKKSNTMELLQIFNTM